MTPALDHLAANLRNRWWRLNNLYWIKDKQGKKVLFKPNWVQEQLEQNLHWLNLVLKSRQHGVTTWAVIRALDTALWRDGVDCGIIAHRQSDAKRFLKEKLLFAYDRLPDAIKKVKAKESVDFSEGVVKFSNGSSVQVSTSFRSGTLQFLHISEYGPMCAQFPAKAEEVKTGALNTVHEGAIVTIESTAQGSWGDFFKRCQLAMQHDRMVQAGTYQLTKKDYRFFFFPWFMDEANTMSEEVRLTEAQERYFSQIETETGVKLTDGQKAWYTKKQEDQGEKMKQEQPSTPKEAFEASNEGSYYAIQLAKAEKDGRVCDLPVLPDVPVDTYWDLGRNNFMAIWFKQSVGPWEHFVDFYMNSGESIDHYAAELKNRGYVYGTCYLPHDAAEIDLTRTDNKSRTEVLQAHGFRCEIVPRVGDLGEGIDVTRRYLARCKFDRVRCGADPASDEGYGGIPALKAYQKKWNQQVQAFHDRPLKNWATDAADAFRQAAQSFTEPAGPKRRKRRKNVNWRTV